MKKPIISYPFWNVLYHSMGEGGKHKASFTLIIMGAGHCPCGGPTVLCTFENAANLPNKWHALVQTIVTVNYVPGMYLNALK